MQIREMKTCEYADGLEHITMLNGMVRLDWYNYTGESGAAPGKEKGETTMPEREVSRQLVLPAGGFLRAYEAMKRFVGQLEAQGIITRSPHENFRPDEKSRPAAGSPNFE